MSVPDPDDVMDAVIDEADANFDHESEMPNANEMDEDVTVCSDRVKAFPSCNNGGTFCFSLRVLEVY